MTNRPCSPGLEPLLGVTYPILDHGFLRVEDYMGTDASITEAARMSTGKTAKTEAEDRGLLNYLMRHHHSTPYEMCEIRFRVKVPIFVARQWVRHRTACLAGDVEVGFDLPGGIRRRGNQKYPLTVKAIWEKFQPTQNVTRPDKQLDPYYKRDRVKRMNIRSCDEDLMQPTHTQIVNIWQCGEKPVIRVAFNNGGVLRASKDHQVFTDQGWLPLSEALSHGAQFCAWGKEARAEDVTSSAGFSEREIAEENWRSVPGWANYDVSDLGRVRGPRGLKTPTISANGYHVVSLSCGTGSSRAHLVHHLVLSAFEPETRNGRDTRHIDHDRTNNRIGNLAWGSAKENADDRMESGCSQRTAMVWASVESYQDDGVEMTYDMEVSGPYHNFCAGGVVVHNSVNEYSMRYRPAITDVYLPEPENLARQDTENKQGRGKLLSPDEANEFIAILEADCDTTQDAYRNAVKSYDLAKELARIGLTLNTYTEFTWKTDLHNLFNFLQQRADRHAQYEIKVYAEKMLEITEAWVPWAYAAFEEHRRGAFLLSKTMVGVLRGLLADRRVPLAGGLTARERRELISALGQDD